MNEIWDKSPMNKQVMNMDFAAAEQRVLAHMMETMSSKQIAELLELRHDNVKRTMERLKDREVIAFTPMEDMQIKGNQREYVEMIYLVNERDSYIVVAQLSPEFAAAIVDHWRQLKGENADLKSMVLEQGKKIDMLCEQMMHPLITMDPLPERVQIKGHKGKRYVRNYDVIEIKSLHIQKRNHTEIALATGFGVQTVQRILKGERDYLLKA